MVWQPQQLHQEQQPLHPALPRPTVDVQDCYSVENGALNGAVRDLVSLAIFRMIQRRARTSSGSGSPPTMSGKLLFD